MVPKLFETIFIHVPIGLAVLDRDGGIAQSNRLWKSLFPSGGTSIGELIVPEERETLENTFLDFLRRKTKSAEIIARPQGMGSSWYRFEFSSVPHPERPGRFILLSVSDISQRQHTEERLENEKQESLVAREEAIRATRTKSEFLANMSHEIRTPIHTIIGSCELLLETALDEEQKEYATQVQYSADVLLGLINDILDFTKIEAGQLNLENISFDLVSLTEESVHLVALQAHKKGLEAITEISGDIPKRLMGDPMRIRQVIVNLFNNAVKFTHQGEIVVSLALLEQDERQAMIRCSVRDSGIGIASAKMDKLFQVFSQIDSSTSRKFGGSGLGLSISKNLITMMGGEIGVDSQEGRGATFWFTLHLKKEEDLSLYDNLTDDFYDDTAILLVEDNSQASEVINTYLSAYGSRVERCENGDQALEMLREHARNGQPFQICMIDQTLPGMDGWQLASEINADKSINNTKLILMTPAGRGGDEAKMKLLKWFDGYLHKPVRRHELFDTLFTMVHEDMELESVEELLEAEEHELQNIFHEEKGSILVAEDHEVNQQLFRTILENMGYTVVLAANGREAVEEAKKGLCDLIFMDVQMPEMNGYEATEEIRRLSISTPIVAVTASAVKGERERCMRLGMNDFLTKPFKKKDIEPLLHKWGTSHVVTIRSEGTEQVEQSEIDPEIFNFDEAISTFMGKKDVVLHLLESFIPRVERQIPILKEALQQSDFKGLREEAHSLKGGSWNLQVMRLGNRSAELEKSALEGQSDRSALNLMGVEDAFQEFKRAAELILLKHKNHKNDAEG